MGAVSTTSPSWTPTSPTWASASRRSCCRCATASPSSTARPRGATPPSPTPVRRLQRMRHCPRAKRARSALNDLPDAHVSHRVETLPSQPLPRDAPTDVCLAEHRQQQTCDLQATASAAVVHTARRVYIHLYIKK